MQGSLRTVLGWLERLDPRPGAAPRLVMEAWYAAGARPRAGGLGDVRLCRRHTGSGARDGSPPADRPHDGGVAHLDGAGCPAQAVLLRGLPIPAADCFRQLGVDVAVRGACSTGTVLGRRLEAGRSVLRRLPHVLTFQRVHAVSTLVTPLSLHGVAVAPVTDRDLKGLQTMVLQAVWGATRLSRAKEVVFVVLMQGHRISPVMHTRYERVLWMTRIARTPGPMQVLVQAIWESGLRPPTTGPFGRAMHVVRLLGWQPLESR